MDIKNIEEISNPAEMKTALMEIATELSDIKTKATKAHVADTLEIKAKAIAERKQAVREFMEAGIETKGNFETFVKQLNLTNNSDSIEEELSREILELAIDNFAFLQEVGVMTVGSTDFRQLVLATRPTVAQTGEQDGTTTPVGLTSTQTYVEVNPVFGKIYSQPEMTNEIIRDMFVDVEADLFRLIAEEESFLMIRMLLDGDGTKTSGIQNLRGLLNVRIDKANAYAEALKPDGTRSHEYFQVIPSGAAGSIGTDAAAVQDILIDVQVSLPTKYLANAKWFMNRRTFAELKKVRDTTGQPIIEWGAFANSANAENRGYIMLGSPIVIVDQMPAIADTETPLMYGDLARAFKMVPLAGSDNLVTDPYTAKGAVRVYHEMRFGEIIGNSDALRVLATQA